MSGGSVSNRCGTETETSKQGKNPKSTLAHSLQIDYKKRREHGIIINKGAACLGTNWRYYILNL